MIWVSCWDHSFWYLFYKIYALLLAAEAEEKVEAAGERLSKEKRQEKKDGKTEK